MMAMEGVMNDLQQRIGTWKSVARVPLSEQKMYFSTLRQLGEMLSANADLPRAETTEMVLMMATEHLLTGKLAWASSTTWQYIISDAMERATLAELDCQHLILPLWSSLLGLCAEVSSSPTLANTNATATLTTAMQILRVMLMHQESSSMVQLPIAHKNSFLPHPHRLSAATRVAYFRVVPHVLLHTANIINNNNTRGSVGSNTSPVHAGLILPAEYLAQYRRGLQAAEACVRRAAIASLADLLPHSVALTNPAALVELLDLLLNASNTATRRSDVRSIGRAIAYLLAQLQVNLRTYNSMEDLQRGCEWQNLFGPDPALAARIARHLLKPLSTYPNLPEVLSSAMAHLFSLCVLPCKMEAAVRCALLLLVPSSADDDRRFMGDVLTQLCQRWPATMRSQEVRLQLLLCFSRYAAPNTDGRLVALTALRCMRIIARTISTPRAARPLILSRCESAATADLRRPAAQLAGRLLAHDDRAALHRLLMELSAAAIDLADLDPCASDLPPNFLRPAETLLAAPPDVLASVDIIQPILAAAFCASRVATEAGAASMAAMRIFFALAELAWRHHRMRISAAMMESMEAVAHNLLTLLVGLPSDAPVYVEAAMAACAWCATRGIRGGDGSLLVGLVEGPMMMMANNRISVQHVRFCKLKACVYLLVVKTYATSATSPPLRDEGSLRWLISQAMNDVEYLSEAGTHLAVEGDSNDDDDDECGGGCFMRTRSIGSDDADIIDDEENEDEDDDDGDEMCAEAEEKVWQTSGRCATALIACGLVELSRTASPFCSSIFARIQMWVESAEHGLEGGTSANAPTSPSSSSPASLAVARARVRAWNLLAMMRAVLRAFANAPPPLTTLWLTNYRGYAEKWVEWVGASSHHGDVRLRGEVAGRLVALLHRVDQHTAAAIKTEARGGDEVALTLSAAHAQAEAAATLPLATSFLADVAKKLNVFGEVAAEEHRCLRLAVARVAAAHPAEAAAALAQPLMDLCLAAPHVEMMLSSVALLHTCAHVLGHNSDLDAIAEVAMQHACSAEVWLANTDADEGLPRMLEIMKKQKQPPPTPPPLPQDAPRAEAPRHPTRTHQQIMLKRCGWDIRRRLLHLMRRCGYARRGATMSSAVLLSAAHLAQVWAACDGMCRSDGDCRLSGADVAMLADASATSSARRVWEGLGCARIAAMTAGVELLTNVAELRAVILAREPSYGEEEAEMAAAHSPLQAENVGRHTFLMHSDDEDETNSLDDGACGSPVERGEAPVPTASAAPPAIACAGVSAKLAAMAMLASAVDHVKATTTSEVLMAILDAVVAAVPRVEFSPYLLRAALHLLRRLLRPELSATLRARLADPAHYAIAPLLLGWQTQLAMAVKSATQIAVFFFVEACEVVLSFLQLNMLHDLSAKRAVRGLSLLVSALSSLESARGISAQGCAHIAITLSAVVVRADKMEWPQTAESARRCLMASVGQDSLAHLCRQWCGEVARAHGYTPPEELATAGGVGVELMPPTEAVDADLLLRTIAALCRGTQQLGPSLRHAAGCVACLLVSGHALRSAAHVRGILPKLSLRHVDMIAIVAIKTLATANIPPEEAVVLADLVGDASAAMPPPQRELMSCELESILPRILANPALHTDDACGELPVVVAGALLRACFLCHCPMAVMRSLLRLLVVEYVLAAPPSFVEAATRFVWHDAEREQASGELARMSIHRSLDTLAASSHCGLMLAEHIATAARERGEAIVSPCLRGLLHNKGGTTRNHDTFGDDDDDGSDDEEVGDGAEEEKSVVRQHLLALLREASANGSSHGLLPRLLLFMWPPSANNTATDQLLLCAIATLRPAVLDAAALDLMRRGLTNLLNAAVAAENPSPLLLFCLQYVCALLAEEEEEGSCGGPCRKQQLRSVGVLLSSRVASKCTAALRAVIQDLGPADAQRLRDFMDQR